jgi:hypothetical protein
VEASSTLRNHTFEVEYRFFSFIFYAVRFGAMGVMKEENTLPNKWAADPQ